MPATKQWTAFGQETAFKLLVPGGIAPTDQVAPAEVVLMLNEPMPTFPLFATARQLVALEHETPVMSTASFGADSLVHVVPLSVVPTR
jgi:hypothetical protein